MFRRAASENDASIMIMIMDRSGGAGGDEYEPPTCTTEPYGDSSEYQCMLGRASKESRIQDEKASVWKRVNSHTG